MHTASQWWSHTGFSSWITTADTKRSSSFSLSNAETTRNVNQTPMRIDYKMKKTTFSGYPKTTRSRFLPVRSPYVSNQISYSLTTTILCWFSDDCSNTAFSTDTSQFSSQFALNSAKSPTSFTTNFLRPGWANSRLHNLQVSDDFFQEMRIYWHAVNKLLLGLFYPTRFFN